MTEYIPVSQELDALAINPEIKVTKQGKELHFENVSLHFSPLSSRTALVQFENQIESGAYVLGDGFQMLCQTAGKLDGFIDIGRCPDNNSSYRIYPEDAPRRFYNYLVVEQSTGFHLYGFTSCHRFAGYFELQHTGHGVDIVALIDGEESSPQHWENNQLESLTVLHGDSLESVYNEYANLISNHHPTRIGVSGDSPIGWCSWYAYYADVTKQNVLENVEIMADKMFDLEWVLLDDGYQSFMGDWLTPSDKFEGGVKSLINNIREKGKKPAIWMAPFIAQAESEVFKNHPEWFLKHDNGELLKAEDITYGGWRCTPWYILDASHPEVQEHLTRVVKTMREEWGVELFKLDANYWGTLKGQRYQKGVTGVEAYRLGMAAINEGAGDALVLGCNAPMWPSLGLVDAMRVSDDVERDPHRFEQIAKETFYRSWQHQRLWLIDPDCATFTSLPNQGTDRASYEFHRNVLLASGGLLLSGDPLPELTPFAEETLARLVSRQRHSTNASTFTSLSMNHATLKLSEERRVHCLFHYDDDVTEYTLTAELPCDWFDYWTGEKLNKEPVQIQIIPVNRGLDSRAIVSVMHLAN
ncbi:glycoside hydrolase family 36 protein [Vibrio barjaei]|uniref:Glycoside hydrolase family 36 protein n=1 Tax=Vibrio barjaei TaxID=1676683 RepID=A0ABW7IFZ6_9VIBR|nr:alpha-galactosidase [Vibrio barjaei]MCY9872844.1 alpha-galactosidase [Vibrio barjaei]OIN26252.1 alpha-galactosidase [Vibrio barjaei]